MKESVAVTLFFIALYFSLILPISIFLKDMPTLRVDIRDCEPIENPKIFYNFNEKTRKLGVNLIVNCCSKIDVKKEDGKYKIRETLKTKNECFCFCKRKIEIYNAEKLEVEFINYKGEYVYIEEFCGKSTFAYCETDEDCMVGGCSGEICQGINENIASVCIWKDCYENLRDYSCKCINKRCQWT